MDRLDAMIEGPTSVSQTQTIESASLPPLRVLAVVGSTHPAASTRIVVRRVAEFLTGFGCVVEILDLSEESLGVFNPETSPASASYPALQKRVAEADVLLLATPDYHGCMSGALKNFLDHFWKEYAGKLVVTLVGSFDKGLTVADQLRTFARQCYAWTLPYAVTFNDREDLKDGKVASESLELRLKMLARDAAVYGQLLAGQRRIDLSGVEQGFMARYRK